MCLCTGHVDRQTRTGEDKSTIEDAVGRIL